MKSQQHGMTLIELMIVLAIIGILSAIAVPAYKDFIIRSKMTEVVAAMAAEKNNLAALYTMTGKFQHDYTVRTSPGKITTGLQNWHPPDWEPKKTVWIHAWMDVGALGMDPKYATAPLLLEGKGRNGGVVWTCGVHPENPLPIEYLPNSCHTTLAFP